MKGSQVVLKVLREPLRENQIISSLRQCTTSLIHRLWLGGEACFHLKRIKRLASKVVKAITLRMAAVVSSSTEIPNMAVRGSGSTGMQKTVWKVLKITFLPIVSLIACVFERHLFVALFKM